VQPSFSSSPWLLGKMTPPAASFGAGDWFFTAYCLKAFDSNQFL
jgi:hypothetical protein